MIPHLNFMLPFCELNITSSHPVIAQNYTVQANGHNSISKPKHSTHGIHSIFVNCNTTSANYGIIMYSEPALTYLGNARTLQQMLTTLCQMLTFLMVLNLVHGFVSYHAGSYGDTQLTRTHYSLWHTLLCSPMYVCCDYRTKHNRDQKRQGR